MAELDEDLDDALDEVDVSSPFHANNAPGLNLIVNMRIYDVLLALLSHFDEETADILYDTHESGGILSALPSYVPQDEDHVPPPDERFE